MLQHFSVFYYLDLLLLIRYIAYAQVSNIYLDDTKVPHPPLV
jgi:hypothetical protein